MPGSTNIDDRYQILPQIRLFTKVLQIYPHFFKVEARFTQDILPQLLKIQAELSSSTKDKLKNSEIAPLIQSYNPRLEAQAN